MTFPLILAHLTGLLANIHASMSAVAVALVAYFHWRDGQREGDPAVPITVLKALEGADSGLEENLRSLFDTPWPAPRQVLLCVPNLKDPAALLGAQLIESYPDLDIEVVASEGRTSCKNRKIQHLLAGLNKAKYDVLVFADADIYTEAATLPRLVGRLSLGEDVGIVYGASSYANEGKAGNRLLSMIFGYGFHAFRTLDALSRFTGGTPAMVGGLWAIRRSHLEAIGGLGIVGDHIGDDLRLAEAAHKAGLKVLASSAPARCFEPALSLQDASQRVLRWIRVLASHQPHKLWGYPGLLAQLPLIILLSLASWALGHGWILPLMGLALLNRFLMALYIGRQHGLRWRPGLLPQLVLAESLLLVLFFRALRGREVQWRGRVYRLEAGGLISEVKG